MRGCSPCCAVLTQEVEPLWKVNVSVWSGRQKETSVSALNIKRFLVRHYEGHRTCLGWQPVHPVVPGRLMAVLINSTRLKSVVSCRAIEGVVFVLTLFLQQ